MTRCYSILALDKKRSELIIKESEIKNLNLEIYYYKMQYILHILKFY